MSENGKQAGAAIMSATDLCDTIRTVRGAISNMGSALQSKALNRLLAHLDALAPRAGLFDASAQMEITIHDIARAEGRHPSAVLADIAGPARAASVGAFCEPWLFVAELRVRLSCKLPACDRMGCSAARGAGESEEP